jgi:hypothetical protein
MEILDVIFLASMSALVVLFAAVAVVEWREARRAGQGADAEVIQHPGDREIHHAA